MFESSSGIVIKRVIALLLALILLAPVAHSAEISSVAAKKRAKITPSPSPVWPPKGFVKSKDGNTFAKIPKAKELVGLASNDKALTRALAKRLMEFRSARSTLVERYKLHQQLVVRGGKLQPALEVLLCRRTILRKPLAQ